MTLVLLNIKSWNLCKRVDLHHNDFCRRDRSRSPHRQKRSHKERKKSKKRRRHDSDSEVDSAGSDSESDYDSDSSDTQRRKPKHKKHRKTSKKKSRDYHSDSDSSDWKWAANCGCVSCLEGCHRLPAVPLAFWVLGSRYRITCHGWSPVGQGECFEWGYLVWRSSQANMKSCLHGNLKK